MRFRFEPDRAAPRCALGEQRRGATLTRRLGVRDAGCQAIRDLAARARRSLWMEAGGGARDFVFGNAARSGRSKSDRAA